MNKKSSYDSIYRIAMLFMLLFFIGFSVNGCGRSPFARVNSGEEEEASSGDSQEEEKEYSLDDYMLSEKKGIYNITSLIPKYEGYQISTYGMRSEDEILIVYKTVNESAYNDYATYSDAADEGNPGEDDYKVVVVNITTGEVTEPIDQWSIARNEYGASVWLSLVSVNPLVMYDYANSTVYYPERDKDRTVSLDPDINGDLFARNGSIYLFDHNGSIYEILDDGVIKEVYTLPYEYSNMYIETGETDSALKVNTTTYKGDSVYLDIDTEKWTEKAYQQDYYNYYFCGCNDDIVYATKNTEGDFNMTLSAIDFKAEKLYEAEVPYEKINDTEVNSSYLDYTAYSKAGKYIVCGMMDYQGDYNAMLLWDFAVVEADEFKENEKTPFEVEEISYDDITEKAEKIEEEFGVEVKFGENIRTEVSDFEFDVYENTGDILNSLDTISEVLDLYPRGMFDSMEKGFVRNTVIFLTGNQRPKDSSINIQDSDGLTSNEDGFMMVFLKISNGGAVKSTLIHELAHVIDRRLENDCMMDEEQWNSMNPEGFDYYHGYVADDGQEYSEKDDYEYTTLDEKTWNENYKDAYFIDIYSKTWPTEDRARLMENLMYNTDYYDPMFQSKHLIEKLKYFSEQIRADLADDSWPKETSWEKRIREYEVYYGN